jgi:hypothetical protein
MAKTLSQLPSESFEIDEVKYVANALPTTLAIMIQDVLIENGETPGWRPDIDLVRKIVVGSRMESEGKAIDKDEFEYHFARRTLHLYNVVDALIQWNFQDVFTEGGSED